MIDECLLGCFYYINRSSQANPSREFDQFSTNFQKVIKLMRWSVDRVRVYDVGGVADLGKKGVAAVLQMAYGYCNAIGRIIGPGRFTQLQ